MDLVSQEYELVDVGRLTPHPDNPRRGNAQLIGELIGSNGFYGAVVAQRSTGHVLAGNHRLAAAVQNGAERLPVIWVDVDDERARRILLADNRSSDQGGYDVQGLLDLLNDLPDLTGTGYVGDDIDALLASLDEGERDAGGREVVDTADADPGEDRYTEQYAVVVICTDAAEQALVYDRLLSTGYTNLRVVTT